MTVAPTDRETVRVDLWLWYARFFRSRSEATGAVKAGHVKIDRQRVKPAREVRIGDHLDIQRGRESIEIVVRALPLRRGPASEASQAYEETAQSLTRRAQARAVRQNLATGPPPTPGRPDKRTQRLLRSERRKGSVLDDE
jgi:ribosome-associated heat shock protein Hsp15